MTEILSMQPDFAEVITWNDGGESHYMGNVWNESYAGTPDILTYANDQQWPHQGWQPLIASFIQAFKSGKSASQMVPPSSEPIGALWYRGVLKNSCSGPPRNSEAALDTVNYAVVMPAESAGLTVQISIDGKTLATVAAQPGLNYGAVPGLASGTPRVDILAAGRESPLWSAVGENAVNAGNVSCNFNFNVAGLACA